MSRLVLFALLLFGWSANAVNLMPNSSFEVGHGRGWIPWQTSGGAFIGNTCFITGMMTNDGYHGGNSMTLTLSKLQSIGIWLTNGTYSWSFYGKSPNGAATVNCGMVNGGDLYNAIPSTSFAVATTWTRYSGTFTASSNAQYWFKWYCSIAFLQVDAIQLEPGGSVTAYTPSATVECGITVPGTNSMYFAGDSPKFRLNYWNAGTSLNQPTRYEVYDSWNSNVLSGTVSPTLAAGTNTFVDVTLPALTGWFRVVSRLTTVNDSYDEASLVVYPYTSNLTTSGYSWLGGHPNISKFSIHRDMLALRTSGRTLSPGYLNTRWDLVQTNRGSFTFYDVGFTNFSAEGMDVLGCLTAADGYWPHWATNIDGTADLGAFSNFCFTVVNRYKTSCTNWEVGPNEPYQQGPTTPINVTIAGNYGQVLSAGISGITNADANARIIGMAGANGGGGWGWEVWTNLTPTIQSKIHAIACHIYPSDVPPELVGDPNAQSYNAGWFNNVDGWATFFNGVRPLWNTESGVWGGATLQGPNAAWPANYNFHSSPAVEASRNELMNRQLDNLVRILQQALRAIGFGFERYYYYDSRIFNDANFGFQNPYAASYEQVDRPEVVSLSVAASKVRRGFGSITNVQFGAYIEAYTYTNGSGNPVIAIWSVGRTNLMLTLTNTFVAVDDAMDNRTVDSTNVVCVRRVPQYLVNTVLTRDQFSNTVKYATIAATTDTLPPHISIDTAPSGLWDGSTNRALVKWTAIDDKSSAWLSDPTSTNVVYRWRRDSGSYGSFGQSNHVWIPNLESGNHTLYVQAMDASGNVAEKSYQFMPVGTTNTLVVAGALTVSGSVLLGQ